MLAGDVTVLASDYGIRHAGVGVMLCYVMCGWVPLRVGASMVG